MAKSKLNELGEWYDKQGRKVTLYNVEDADYFLDKGYTLVPEDDEPERGDAKIQPIRNDYGVQGEPTPNDGESAPKRKKAIKLHKHMGGSQINSKDVIEGSKAYKDAIADGYSETKPDLTKGVQMWNPKTGEMAGVSLTMLDDYKADGFTEKVPTQEEIDKIIEGVQAGKTTEEAIADSGYVPPSDYGIQETLAPNEWTGEDLSAYSDNYQAEINKREAADPNDPAIAELKRLRLEKIASDPDKYGKWATTEEAKELELDTTWIDFAEFKEDLTPEQEKIKNELRTLLVELGQEGKVENRERIAELTEQLPEVDTSKADALIAELGQQRQAQTKLRNEELKNVTGIDFTSDKLADYNPDIRAKLQKRIDEGDDIISAKMDVAKNLAGDKFSTAIDTAKQRYQQAPSLESILTTARTPVEKTSTQAPTLTTTLQQPQQRQAPAQTTMPEYKAPEQSAKQDFLSNIKGAMPSKRGDSYVYTPENTPKPQTLQQPSNVAQTFAQTPTGEVAAPQPQQVPGVPQATPQQINQEAYQNLLGQATQQAGAPTPTTEEVFQQTQQFQSLSFDKAKEQARQELQPYIDENMKKAQQGFTQSSLIRGMRGQAPEEALRIAQEGEQQRTAQAGVIQRAGQLVSESQQLANQRAQQYIQALDVSTRAGQNQFTNLVDLLQIQGQDIEELRNYGLNKRQLDLAEHESNVNSITKAFDMQVQKSQLDLSKAKLETDVASTRAQLGLAERELGIKEYQQVLDEKQRSISNMFKQGEMDLMREETDLKRTGLEIDTATKAAELGLKDRAMSLDEYATTVDALYKNGQLNIAERNQLLKEEMFDFDKQVTGNNMKISEFNANVEAAYKQGLLDNSEYQLKLQESRDFFNQELSLRQMALSEYDTEINAAYKMGVLDINEKEYLLSEKEQDFAQLMSTAKLDLDAMIATDKLNLDKLALELDAAYKKGKLNQEQMDAITKEADANYKALIEDKVNEMFTRAMKLPAGSDIQAYLKEEFENDSDPNKPYIVDAYQKLYQMFPKSGTSPLEKFAADFMEASLMP